MTFLTNLPMPAAAAIAAFVPMIMGFIWYNPKVFGKAWMDSIGMTEDKLKEGFNMPLVMGLCYIFSFFLAFGMVFATIHEYHIFSMFMNEANEFKEPHNSTAQWVISIMNEHGSNFRTFKHGAFHGILSGFMFALPIVGINALFERRGFKYIAIHVGFWIVCMSLMGGFVCHACKMMM
jgi:hypothetical protein